MVRTNSHAQTHTCTRSEVPVLHFLIHCYSPSPPAWSFYDSLSSSWAVWLQEGTSLLNSPCIFRRPVIKEGARAVKQRVGKRDINTSSLLSDSWTPDMSEKTNRKRRCKIGPVVKKRVIRGAQNLLLRVSHIHKKEKGTSTSELFRFLCMFHLPSKKPSHWFSCDVKMEKQRPCQSNNGNSCQHVVQVLWAVSYKTASFWRPCYTHIQNTEVGRATSPDFLRKGDDRIFSECRGRRGHVLKFDSHRVWSRSTSFPTLCHIIWRFPRSYLIRRPHEQLE